MSKTIEIRRNHDGSIDEIVAHNADLHIEQMDDAGWFIVLDMPDGSYWQFWFGAKNKKSHVEVLLTETVTAEELKAWREISKHQSAGVQNTDG